MKIFGKKVDLDGIFKNWSVVYSEVDNLRSNTEYAAQIVRFEESSWIPQDGKENKFHTGTNLLKEAIVLCPRTTTYLIIYSVLVFGLLWFL
jgi:hypothetical protein